MNEALASLSKTDGVIGVVVFDEQGHCVANDLPPPYEPILLAQVVKRLHAAFDAFGTLEEGDVSSFSVDCEDGSVVLRRVEQNWVLALTHPDVNMNMLNVAMNVVVLNLSRNSHSGMHRATRPSTDSLVTRSTTLGSMTGSDGELEIPPDAVDRAVLQQLVIVYQEYIGPAAKAVLKQQLAALGVTSRTLRRGQFGDFVARLATKVPNVDRQREFLTAARKLSERMLSK
jgi:predicted regulator of Ras-like GTPase activity (Roadblock/LC7/MglB family)